MARSQHNIQTDLGNFNIEIQESDPLEMPSEKEVQEEHDFREHFPTDEEYEQFLDDLQIPKRYR
jgi:hypothetical protein